MENKQTIQNDCIVAVAKGQTVVSTDVDVRDRGGVSKILSVSTDAVVTSVEAVAGAANVYGRVNYKMMYLDLEGKTCGIDYFGEFDFAVEDENIAVGDTTASASVLDADCTLSGNKMHLEAVVEVNLLQVVRHEAEILTACEGEYRTETISTLSLTPVGESVFEVVEEAESGVAVDRVLFFDAKVVHTGTRKGVDSTTVEGKVYAEVVYLSQGNIRTQNMAFDFAEQLDLEGDVDLSVALRSSKLILTGEEDANVLRVEAVLVVSGYRMVAAQYEALCDAYMDGMDLSIVRDAFACRRYLGLVSRTERISAHIDAQDLDVAGGIIAATVGRVGVAGFTAGEGQITAEGLAVVDILYTGEDGAPASGEVELPFSVTFAAEGVTPDCTLVGDAMAISLVASARGMVEMDLLFAVKCYRPVSVSYVTDLACTPCAVDAAVMSVYFAPADAGLWDIARAVHVSPETLLAQNPALAEPATCTRRITVFRHRDL